MPLEGLKVHEEEPVLSSGRLEDVPSNLGDTIAAQEERENRPNEDLADNSMVIQP